MHKLALALFCLTVSAAAAVQSEDETPIEEELSKILDDLSLTDDSDLGLSDVAETGLDDDDDSDAETGLADDDDSDAETGLDDDDDSDAETGLADDDFEGDVGGEVGEDGNELYNLLSTDEDAPNWKGYANYLKKRALHIAQLEVQRENRFQLYRPLARKGWRARRTDTIAQRIMYHNQGEIARLHFGLPVDRYNHASGQLTKKEEACYRRTLTTHKRWLHLNTDDQDPYTKPVLQNLNPGGASFRTWAEFEALFLRKVCRALPRARQQLVKESQLIGPLLRKILKSPDGRRPQPWIRRVKHPLQNLRFRAFARLTAAQYSMPSFIMALQSLNLLGVSKKLHTKASFEPLNWPFNLMDAENAFRYYLQGKLREYNHEDNFEHRQYSWVGLVRSCYNRRARGYSCSAKVLEELGKQMAVVTQSQYNRWANRIDATYMLATNGNDWGVSSSVKCCNRFFQTVAGTQRKCNAKTLLANICKQNLPCLFSAFIEDNQRDWSATSYRLPQKEIYISQMGDPGASKTYAIPSCPVPNCAMTMLGTIATMHGQGLCQAYNLVNKPHSTEDLDEGDEVALPPSHAATAATLALELQPLSTPTPPSLTSRQMDACDGCPWPAACQNLVRPKNSYNR